jgi:hypothetical protein
MAWDVETEACRYSGVRGRAAITAPGDGKSAISGAIVRPRRRWEPENRTPLTRGCGAASGVSHLSRCALLHALQRGTSATHACSAIGGSR